MAVPIFDREFSVRSQFVHRLQKQLSFFVTSSLHIAHLTSPLLHVTRSHETRHGTSAGEPINAQFVATIISVQKGILHNGRRFCRRISQIIVVLFYIKDARPRDHHVGLSRRLGVQFVVVVRLWSMRRSKSAKGGGKGRSMSRRRTEQERIGRIEQQGKEQRREGQVQGHVHDCGGVGGDEGGREAGGSTAEG